MTETASFSSVPLPAAQRENLTQLGYLQMTPIQARTLPLTLKGQDLIAQAKTGSGKTAAFGLPLLHRLNPRFFGTQALVLCPTRELAAQVADELRKLARYQPNIKIVTLCGGQPIGPQIGSLSRGAHIVVGTPGRIKDHLRKETLDIRQVQTLVLDEADRMLDMGFIDDIRTILRATPDDRQTLLFSATYPEDIRTLSDEFQRQPVSVRVETIHDEACIDQYFFQTDPSERMVALLKLLNHFNPESAVIFCNTKQAVNDVCTFLSGHDVSIASIHGDLDQRARDQVLTRFRLQSLSVLVATDVAARGLDVDDLPAVINYELPRDPQVYVHRIGRTGRAGKPGIAASLFTGNETNRMADIEAGQGRTLPSQPISSLPSGSHRVSPPPYATLCIAAGRKQKIRPGDVLGALTGDAGLPATSVGKISVSEHATYVAIDRSQAQTALGRLLNGKIKGRKFKVRKVD